MKIPFEKSFIITVILLIIVSCNKEEPKPPIIHSISISANSGGSVSSNGGSYEEGTSISVYAIPDSEYVFLGWSTGSNENPLTFTVSSSQTITANFTKKKYALDVSVVGDGTVTEEVVNSGKDYDSGSVVRLTAVPTEGWEFTGWGGAVVSSELSIELTINEAKQITASFGELNIESIAVENLIDELIVSHKYTPIVYVNYTNGEKLDISDRVNISSVYKKTTLIDENSIIGAVKGNEKLLFEFEGYSTEVNFFVNNIEFEELDAVFLEEKESYIKVPYLMINFYPTNDGIIQNDTIGPSSYAIIQNPALDNIKLKIKNILITSKNAIEIGSAYRDYGANEVKPYVSLIPKAYVNIYITKDINYRTVRLSNGLYTYDYSKLFLDLNIEDYVNNQGVKEIWITEFPYGAYPALIDSGIYEEGKDSLLPESNMASSLTGDISNSYRIQNDLPIYNKTYIVYGNNGHRGVDTNLHNRGHQIEAMLNHIEKDKQPNQYLFWNKFVGISASENGLIDYSKQALNGRVGSTHFPPNGEHDYDYDNDNLIESDIFNWTPQGGQKQNVNSDTWKSMPLNFTYNKYSDDGIENINSNPQTKWLITWFQSFPGENNNIPYFRDGEEYTLTNWWDLFYNWDDAISNNKTLWE